VAQVVRFKIVERTSPVCQTGLVSLLRAQQALQLVPFFSVWAGRLELHRLQARYTDHLIADGAGKNPMGPAPRRRETCCVAGRGSSGQVTGGTQAWPFPR
jgi:hypothetical protein